MRLALRRLTLVRLALVRLAVWRLALRRLAVWRLAVGWLVLRRPGALWWSGRLGRALGRLAWQGPAVSDCPVGVGIPRARLLWRHDPLGHSRIDISRHCHIPGGTERLDTVMRILVTGGSGRLGRAVLERLSGGGFHVRAVSRGRRPSGEVEWVVADLTTGDGVAAAVAGVDVIVHLAAAPYKGRYTAQVELDGTRRLLAAARAAGVRHVIYTSIVGVDRVPWGYFRTKVRAESVIRSGGVPWTIVRVTQFHEFVDQALRGLARLGVMVVDPGIEAQPVDVRDVAGVLTERVAAGPAESVIEYGGPQVLDADVALEQWMRARGVRRRVLRLRLPGKLGRAFRAGHMTTKARPTGTITWADYLSR